MLNEVASCVVMKQPVNKEEAEAKESYEINLSIFLRSLDFFPNPPASGLAKLQF